MTAPDNQYLFVIGAYRDNEVHEAHPLMLALDEIQKDRKHGESYCPATSGLPRRLSVNCRHTQVHRREKSRPLAELVLTKTNGNPFFVNEFLKSLYTEELLTFDFQSGIGSGT